MLSAVFLFSRCLCDCAGRSARLFVFMWGMWKARVGSRCSPVSSTAVPFTLVWLYFEVAAILWRTQRTWQPRPWLKRTLQRPMELPPPSLRIYATRVGMNRSFGNILFQPDRYRDYLIWIRVRRSSSITRYVGRFILHRVRDSATDRWRSGGSFGWVQGALKWKEDLT